MGKTLMTWTVYHLYFLLPIEPMPHLFFFEKGQDMAILYWYLIQGITRLLMGKTTDDILPYSPNPNTIREQEVPKCTKRFT